MIGLVAYIPATPVQAYLSLTLKKLGFSTLNSNLLSIPSAALQVILMLALANSSEYFDDRTWHCAFGEFWVLPLLASLLALPPRGYLWGRFTVTTMISGCKLRRTSSLQDPLMNFRSLLPSDSLSLDLGKLVRRPKASYHSGNIQCHSPDRQSHRLP